MAYIRKISLLHAGLVVMFFLQYLVLHTVIQSTGTRVPFTSSFFWFLNQNNLNWHKHEWTSADTFMQKELYFLHHTQQNVCGHIHERCETFERKALSVFSQSILPKLHASSDR